MGKEFFINIECSLKLKYQASHHVQGPGGHEGVNSISSLKQNHAQTLHDMANAFNDE